MDLHSLQKWFDGGDVTAIAFGIASIAASIWVYSRQRRLDTENLKLQRRLAEIEEERRSEEVERTMEADIRVSLRRELSPRRNSWNYFLDITNSGGAAAEQVTLQEFKAPASGSEPLVVGREEVFPIPALQPGERVTCAVALSMGMGNAFEATVGWVDARGPQTAKRIVTIGG